MGYTCHKALSITVKQGRLQTHPAALSDPVAQPPVAEGYAACGGEEEEGVDEEDYWTSRCFDVGTIHRPGDCTRALLLSFHQLFYIKKDVKNEVTDEPLSRKTSS